jgi:hypothetical protein
MTLCSALCILSTWTGISQESSLVFQSSETQTSLIELYSSEGCSSCPPAEAWLSGLKNSKGLWRDFVPVAFHVDYWDYLGWRDPWASKQFTQRQHAYASQWRSQSVYTPGLVLNGKEWHDWSAQKDGPSRSALKAGVLKISSTDSNHWQVSFSPTGQSAGDYEAHGVLLENELHSDVKAGENRGRRLNHDFVVTSLITSPLKKDGEVFIGELELKDSGKGAAQHPAIAVWVTRTGRLDPLQSVGGLLSK